jgi:tripartite-type tricarboxylate transporter receptor subunit TctC
MLNRWLVAAALVGAVPGAQGAAAQSDYPNRPLRLIVPYAAGGGTDFFARLVGGGMSTALGQQVVVENLPGAGTLMGAELTARAAPDGYTFLLGDTSTYASNPSLYQKLPYDPQKDFSPISLTGRFAVVLLVNTDKLKVSSLKELVAEAKKNPGKIDYASSGLGSPFHLAAELFAQTAGIQINHVPYKGAGPAIQDLVAGQMGMMFVDFATARGQLAHKQIKVIAVCSPSEFYALPGVPTVAASYPGFEAWAWQGFVAPAGAPQAIIMKLHDAYLAAVEDKETRAKLKGAGIDLLQSSPQDMANYIRSETEKWAKVIHAANIKLD